MPTFDCHPENLLDALQTMGPARGYTYVIVLLRIYAVGGPIDDDMESLARRTGLTIDVITKSLAWLFEKKKLHRVGGRIMNRVAARVLAQQKQKTKSRESDSPHNEDSRSGLGSDAGKLGVPDLLGACGESDTERPDHCDSGGQKEGNTKKRASRGKKSANGSALGIMGKSGNNPDWPSDAFDQFWALVPPGRRVEKARAQKAFLKIRQSGEVTWEKFFAGVVRWNAASIGREVRFIKHPATWLNAGCWDDEIAPAAARKRNLWDVARGAAVETSDERNSVEIFAPGEIIPGTRAH